MCVKLGYILPPNLHVDHINDDKTDDRIENLQILTPEQNAYKETLRHEYEQEYYAFQCAHCLNYFYLSPSHVNDRIRKKVIYAFCSRSCATNFHYSQNGNSNKKITDEKIMEFKRLKSLGFSSYKIAEMTGEHRSTVQRYY